MHRVKRIQHLLLIIAAAAVLLCVCIPLRVILPLRMISFCVFVLLPQVIGILLQIRTVEECFREYRKAVEALKYCGKERSEQKTRRICIVFDTLHRFAREKSGGINPNRAGPIGIAA